MAYSTTIINEVNSPVSYTDILGLYFGLNRFVGETNVQFLQRLYRSSNAIKNSSLQGLIDTISLNLNLNIYQSISITNPTGLLITLVPGVLTLGTTAYPLFNLASDTYLEWMQLSDVVNIINSVSDLTAELLVPDTSILTLSKQSNLQIALNEGVSTTNLSYTVENSGLIPSSILFNLNAPSYTINGNTLTFASIPISGLEISYQYINSSFNLISSDVNLISLSDRTLIAKATNSSNVLGYQLREAIQKIMKIDGSYWAS